MADAHTDPRAARTRAAVLAAAAKVIAEEGAGAVTHQRVAERAGVGRATMYRHWPTAADLMYDALAEVETPLFHRHDGPFLPWLRAELSRISVEISQPNGMQFTAVLMSRLQFDPEAVALRDRLLERSLAPLALAVERALVTGELTAPPPVGDLLALLVGPLQFRSVFEGRPVPPEFIDAVIVGALGRYLPG
ncbi:MAG: TetR/AcrR family transcriptional regulator [Actinomycetota bacterium]|nr:TetR/AcrR family transcriptional regulator [Actinomycetota bacterium]